MTLSLLFDAGPVIYLHAFAAMAAFLLGIIQFIAPKGTLPHRSLGWIWVTLMAGVCLSSFFIHTIRSWGEFSPIHLLSIFTLVMLVLGVRHARRGEISRHQRRMVLLFVGALLIAGLFTFTPGRIMHKVLFSTVPRPDTAANPA
jgi:uncharacterized membrane protein